MTREEIIEGLKLLEDNMVYFDELLNDKGEYIDVHELLFEAIEVLEQEPTTKENLVVEDCISKKALIEYANNLKDGIGITANDIVRLPSIQPKPKTGHWITQWNAAHQKEYYYCSECREEFSYDGETGIKMSDYDFCPNCGAKMESEDKE